MPLTSKRIGMVARTIEAEDDEKKGGEEEEDDQGEKDDEKVEKDDVEMEYGKEPLLLSEPSPGWAEFGLSLEDDMLKDAS